MRNSQIEVTRLVQKFLGCVESHDAKHSLAAVATVLACEVCRYAEREGMSDRMFQVLINNILDLTRSCADENWVLGKKYGKLH